MTDSRSFSTKAKAFLAKPFSEQSRIISRYSKRRLRKGFKKIIGKLLPFVAVPQRIEEGAWWLAANDHVGDGIYIGTFERYERQFVSSFLRSGMAMFDVGAHHGLYSVIAATRVGRLGRVVSFEPSPRERARLATHRRINHLDQITIEGLALGKERGNATLYLPTKRNSGFNSLAPSDFLKSEADNVTVEVETLDEYVTRNKIESVDLMKIDVEGGERDVLLGGERFFSTGGPRPVVLCEVEDERTLAWGYPAREVIRFLEEKDYIWFLPRPDGRLTAFDTQRDNFAHNLVAVPVERRSQISEMAG